MNIFSRSAVILKVLSEHFTSHVTRKKKSHETRAIAFLLLHRPTVTAESMKHSIHHIDFTEKKGEHNTADDSSAIFLPFSYLCLLFLWCCAINSIDNSRSNPRENCRQQNTQRIFFCLSAPKTLRERPKKKTSNGFGNDSEAEKGRAKLLRNEKLAGKKTETKILHTKKCTAVEQANTWMKLTS